MISIVERLHHDAIALLRRLMHPLGLGGVRGKRLLTKHVLSGIERTQRKIGERLPTDDELRDAAEFGMIGLLNAGGTTGGKEKSPTAPWGRDDSLGLNGIGAGGDT